MAKTFDSTLAFFVNQLDKFDEKLHMPLFDTTWPRDINLLEGLSMANESASFVRGKIGGPGTQNAQGIPWISANTNAIPGVSVDGDRIVTPINLCGRTLSYSSVELERSQLMGQSIDRQKYDAMITLYNLSADQMVYVGDGNSTGLVNSPEVLAGNVTGGAWATKTPDEILDDVNAAIEAAWKASGYAVCPDKLLLPPEQYALICSRKVSNDASKSIATYLEESSIALRRNGRKLDIQSCKWLDKAGAGETARMVAYTNKVDYVRFPMVPIRRETPYYEGITFYAPYIWSMGAVQFVYPETAIYRDGI